MKVQYLIALICLSFVAIQCTKPDTTPQSPSTISSATPYINATIDSTSISLAPGNQYKAYVKNSLDNLNSAVAYNFEISSLLSGNQYIAAIYAGEEQFSTSLSKPADTSFYSYFNLGHKKFAFAILTPNTYHVAFNWVDNSGNTWQSNPPPGTGGDQTGSSFVVDTFIQTSPNYGGSTAIKMQAHFNCKIYFNGNSKKVTNGTCVVYFENE